MCGISLRPVGVAVVLLACVLPGAGLAGEGPPLLIVLDASGSMWGRVGGIEKIVVAKSTVIDLLDDLGTAEEIGMIAYGHRREGDCDDIELLAPVAAGQAAALIEKVQALNPRGKTPIVRALGVAAEQAGAGGRPLAVVLVSDGRETCDDAPCDFVAGLKARGVELTLYVIGFDVAQDERAELECLAEAGGGAYYAAADAAELQRALRTVRDAVVAPAEGEGPGMLLVSGSGKDLYDVFRSDDGSKVTTAGTNTAVELEAGSYLVGLGGARQLVTVRAGETTRLGAGTLVVAGLGESLWAVFDATGAKKIDFTRTNKPVDLLEGSYLVELGGTRRPVVVRADEKTTVEAASLTVAGSSGSLYGVFDPTGTTKYAFTSVGRTVELLPGFYSVQVAERWFRNLELAAGQRLTLEE